MEICIHIYACYEKKEEAEERGSMLFLIKANRVCRGCNFPQEYMFPAFFSSSWMLTARTFDDVKKTLRRALMFNDMRIPRVAPRLMARNDPICDKCKRLQRMHRDNCAVREVFFLLEALLVSLTWRRTMRKSLERISCGERDS